MGSKKRRSLAISLKGKSRRYNATIEDSVEYVTLELYNLQNTESTGNPWPPRGRHVGQDVGANFYTQKVVHNPGYIEIFEDNKWRGGIPIWGNVREYHGPQVAFASQKNDNYDSPVISSVSQLNALGTTGIARSLPTNPLSGMGQFIGELRDIPKIPFKSWKRQARVFRNLARNGSKEYLNIQFGWVPFVKDIRDFAKVASSHSSRIANYERNSGRNVRRRQHVFSDSSSTVTNLGPSYGEPGTRLHPDLQGTQGVLLKTVTQKREVTFSGAFTYYLPPTKPGVAGWKRTEALANKLYGTRLSPELLWQLAPWSWAADWVTNIGDVVHNWVAFQNDGLVMRYGYVMENSSLETSYSLRGATLHSGRSLDCTQSWTNTVKQRRKATPYGFGLSPEAFSARQWSIIAALGISKSPRSFNF